MSLSNCQRKGLCAAIGEDVNKFTDIYASRHALALVLTLLIYCTTSRQASAARLHTALHSPQRAPGEQLAVVTVATDRYGPQVTQLLESCRSRYNITVLGNGLAFRGMLTKLTLVMQHLHTLAPDQLVLFLDQDVR